MSTTDTSDREQPRFEQRLPPSATAADVFVSAPGFATRFLRQPLSGTESEIVLSQGGGAIRLELYRQTNVQ